MGQCICTLCTLPACCAGGALAPRLGRRALVAGCVLTALGGLAFALLSIQCGGVDFFGGNGNGCWSEGSPKGEGLGLVAALGLGLGVPSLAYAALRPPPPKPALELAQHPPV